MPRTKMAARSEDWWKRATSLQVSELAKLASCVRRPVPRFINRRDADTLIATWKRLAENG